MKKEIADLWVAALRSGEYQQEKGTLVKVDHDNGDILGYCCLGVLCELAVKAGVPVTKDGGQDESDEPDDSYYTSITFDNNDALTPESVRKWSGLRSSDGSVADWPMDPSEEYTNLENDFPTSLAGLNDGGKTFNEIADLIEKHYEVL
jgi:hypothetical protein